MSAGDTRHGGDDHDDADCDRCFPPLREIDLCARPWDECDDVLADLARARGLLERWQGWWDAYGVGWTPAMYDDARAFLAGTAPPAPPSLRGLSELDAAMGRKPGWKNAPPAPPCDCNCHKETWDCAGRCDRDPASRCVGRAKNRARHAPAPACPRCSDRDEGHFHAHAPDCLARCTCGWRSGDVHWPDCPASPAPAPACTCQPSYYPDGVIAKHAPDCPAGKP